MNLATRARRPLAALACAALAACAGPQLRPPPPADTDAAQCVELFATVDATIDRAGVRDAMATRIAGFPHLRVDRLLASFREVGGEAATRLWIERLGQLDAAARTFELANLPPYWRAELEHALADPTLRIAERLRRCREVLIEADLADQLRLASLRRAAEVPDDYSLARRTLGLYPLTRLPFAAGVRAFERRTLDTFAQPLDALPTHGRRLRFAPPAAPSIEPVAMRQHLADAAANALALPLPGAETLHRLALALAPVFDVDVIDGNDLIGHPYWPTDGPVAIDIARTAVFYRAAHARFGDDVLLQLVYTAWFPARPRTGPFDLLGGHLDALVWRVTLGPDGEPLLFDSMHGCGCYHFFFPTVRVRPLPHDGDPLEEWLFTPQPPLPRLGADQRAVLRVATRSHYLERVQIEPVSFGADIRYRLEPDDGLRSLPHPQQGRRSTFDSRGFVAGSERAERLVFWPMGVVNPGAMRQWGRHATAFVGRRHFDDPQLIDVRFEYHE